MINATTKARTSYIKSEAFQLLSTLYTIKKDDNESLHTKSIKILESNVSNLALSLQSTYKDDEMLKAKRLNDVLKANTLLIQFVKGVVVSKSFWNNMGSLIELLQSIQMQSTSTSIKTKCGNVMQSIQDGLVSHKEVGDELKKEKKKKDDGKKTKNDEKIDDSKKSKNDKDHSKKKKRKNKSKDDSCLEIKEKKKDESSSNKDKKKSKRRLTK